jgi:hypothetical protein
MRAFARRGQRTEGRGQRAEDRGQRTEDRGQRTEDRGQRTEDRGQPDLQFRAKNLRDFFDRVPIAGRRCDAEFFLDLAEVADRFHLPTIQTQDESVFDRNDL